MKNGITFETAFVSATGMRWIVANDKPRMYPLVFEIHENGEVTEWLGSFSVAYGCRGKLKLDAKLKPVTRNKERDEVERIERRLQRTSDFMQVQYDNMKAQERR